MMPSDHRLAAELAEAAGRLLLALRAEGGDPGELRRRGDRLSHEFLAAQIAARRPGDAILSEEGRDDLERITADRVWIIDPLDGTREFGERERTDWAVHVALWERGALTAGAVALPAQDQVLSTAQPPLRPASGEISDGLRVVVSRSRPPAFLPHHVLGTEVTIMPLGSAGAKAAVVIRGEADAYIHSGGQYEWDSAAPVAVAQAAGLHASRLDGSPLAYNQPEPALPDILICPMDLAAPLLDAISATAGSGHE